MDAEHPRTPREAAALDLSCPCQPFRPDAALTQGGTGGLPW